MRRDEIARLLPEVFQRTLEPGSPLAAWLGVMEELHAPAEAVLAQLESHFDPRQTPERLLPMLAAWVDLTRFMRTPTTAPDASDLISSGTGHLRELIAAALALSQARGTRQGLLRFLEVATGLTGYRIEENLAAEAGPARPFHLLVQAPAAARAHEALVRRIVEQEKPAYVTFELTFGTPD